MKDMHLSLDQFEFQSDLTTDYGVSCSLGSENMASSSFLGYFNSVF